MPMPFVRLRHLLTLSLLLVPAALSAQVQATTGIIRGTVSSADGSPISRLIAHSA
jgi:hypothetical protein